MAGPTKWLTVLSGYFHIHSQYIFLLLTFREVIYIIIHLTSLGSPLFHRFFIDHLLTTFAKGDQVVSNRSFRPSKIPGILIRQHRSRKHGVRFDQYFAIYYRFNGKNYQEGVGWASDGWTPTKVRNLLVPCND